MPIVNFVRSDTHLLSSPSALDSNGKSFREKTAMLMDRKELLFLCIHFATILSNLSLDSSGRARFIWMDTFAQPS
jgi:hypothetical protein